MANDLIRWEDPFSGLTTLHSQLDDMFNNFFSGSLPALTHTLPAMDVYTKDDKELVAEVHAPGFDKEDIDVSVHEGVLEIKGEKHTKEEDKKSKRSYMMQESSASFYRRVALPRYANGDKVEAKFDNGVLKVTVPFKELPKPQKVAIQAGK
ncbi:MAG TPA: Hsp20/alpha crystallin family protein [Candidatus Binatia bacterium]|nr:Hsp20/alpha crystallin family protein [Candidatus Binatia bacterium]